MHSSVANGCARARERWRNRDRNCAVPLLAAVRGRGPARRQDRDERARLVGTTAIAERTVFAGTAAAITVRAIRAGIDRIASAARVDADEFSNAARRADDPQPAAGRGQRQPGYRGAVGAGARPESTGQRQRSGTRFRRVRLPTDDDSGRHTAGDRIGRHQRNVRPTESSWRLDGRRRALDRCDHGNERRDRSRRFSVDPVRRGRRDSVRNRRTGDRIPRRSVCGAILRHRA